MIVGKVTQQELREVIEKYKEIGINYIYFAKKMNIDKSSFCHWMKKDKDFKPVLMSRLINVINDMPIAIRM